MRFPLILCAVLAGAASAAVKVDGDLRRWSTVTLTFDGPQTSEDARPNPFRDYRMNVTFRHAKSGLSLTVPGYFAADANAAETSAKAGSKWRVHFKAGEQGEWEYQASFREGTDIVLSPDTGAGRGTAFDGERGTLRIRPAAPKTRGLLRYTGGHYLQYAGTGEYYLKGGAASPENFLAYEEFDNTRDADADSGSYKKVGPFIHHYQPHVKDWKKGDPSWKGGRGKGIVGALNYLAGKGVNSVYFLTYNIDGGDGRDTWMWTDVDTRDRYDVSKLAQWNIVFEHMDRKGIMLHVVTQETENDRRLGGSAGLNDIRKIYYRELVARFAHHDAVMWNLGEENNTPDADRKAIAAYIRSLDAYNHPITVHTHNNKALSFYDAILGDPSFEATSIQGSMKNYNHDAIVLRKRSAEAGRKWAIFGDEQPPDSKGVLPDDVDASHDEPRTQALWGNLMGGGSGVEWYFGYSYPNMDINCEDFRSRDRMWDQTRYALEFFRKHLPLTQMEPDNDRAANAYVLAKADEVIAVYLPAGGQTTVKLGPGKYTVQWYNPRTGGALLNGATVAGGTAVSPGKPPADPDKDWAILLKKVR